jgi:hypothetical protein
MGTRKPKSKQGSNGHRPRNGSAQTFKPAADSDVRSYSIPDYRLEHPDLSVRQTIEKGKDGAEHVRYEVTGDLERPSHRFVTPSISIRSSASRFTATCCSTAKWRLGSKISISKGR